VAKLCKLFDATVLRELSLWGGGKYMWSEPCTLTHTHYTHTQWHTHTNSSLERGRERASERDQNAHT